MDLLADSKSIFEQLADADNDAVRAFIENHDAWMHNAAVQCHITAALRIQIAAVPRAAAVSRRLADQRRALQALAITLPQRLANAG